MRQELQIPPEAQSADRAVELIRVWLASEQVHCVLKVGFWEERFDERECWGILLADIMHHIANAHHTEYGRDPVESIAKIRESLERELENATSERLGGFTTDSLEPESDG